MGPSKNIEDKKKTYDYETLVESGKPSDVVLVASEKEIRAHKFVLSDRSPVFAAMFAHESTKEAQQNRVDIIDVEVEVLELLVRFAYTGTVDTLGLYAPDLLVAADKYQIDSLKAICEKRLLRQISTESFSDLLILGDMHQATKLTTKCLDYIIDNATQVIASKGWKTIVTRADLLAILFARLNLKYSNIFINGEISDSEDEIGSMKNKEYYFGCTRFKVDWDFELYLLEISNVVECKEETTVLVVGDTELKVHKQMLSVGSPVFAAMFDTIKENRVQINSDVDVKAFKWLIKYIYTGKVEGFDRYSKYSLSKLFVAADQYELNCLKSICVQQLMSKPITTKSVSGLLIIAEIHQITELYTKCLEYTSDNVTQVITSEGWKKIVLKTDLLTKLCERLNLNFSDQLLLCPITIESVLNLLILADMHQVTELTTKCVEYITENGTEVMQEEDWKKIVLRADLMAMLCEHLSLKYTRVCEKILSRNAKRNDYDANDYYSDNSDYSNYSDYFYSDDESDTDSD